MIQLESYQQALELKDQIPALALLRMKQLEGEDGLYCSDSHGYLIVFQDGDQLHDLPVGESLEPNDPIFEYVRYVEEAGVRVYEAVIAIDNEKMVGVIIPTSIPIPPDLCQLLDGSSHKEIITN